MSLIQSIKYLNNIRVYRKSFPSKDESTPDLLIQFVVRICDRSYIKDGEAL